MAKKNSGSQYVGFWIRLIAECIDAIIFYVIYLLMSFFLVFTPFPLLSSLIIIVISSCLIRPFYEIFFTAKYGGTIGKLIIKCKVVDSNGNNISFLDSAARYFSKILSGLILCIGYLMIAWDVKKQGLHDKIAQTFVVQDNKSKITNNARKYIIIAAILAIACYWIYSIYIPTISIIAALGDNKKEIGTIYPVQSILDNCDSKLPYYKDICISHQLKNKEILLLNGSDKLDLCSKLSGQYKSSCFAQVAAENHDDKVCSQLSSSYSRRLCSKEYDFTLWIMDNFLNFNKLNEDSMLNENYIENTQLNGTTQTYTFGGVNYKITPFVDKDSVQFAINGWLTPPLTQEQIEYVTDGAYLKVKQIIVHPTGNYVIFELGKGKDNIEEFIESNPNSIRDTLSIGKTKTYTINNVDYEITLSHVYSTSVQFVINGWTTEQIVPMQEDVLPDGSRILLVRMNQGNANYKFAEFLLEPK